MTENDVYNFIDFLIKNKKIELGVNNQLKIDKLRKGQHELWTTRDFETKEIKNMDNDHVKNCVYHLKERAEFLVKLNKKIGDKERSWSDYVDEMFWRFVYEYYKRGLWS